MARPKKNRGSHQNKALREVRALRREVNGHPIKRMPIDPPIVNKRPYYPLVITEDLPDPGVAYTFDTATLVRHVAATLGLSDQTKTLLTLKLRSIKGWAYMYGSTADRVSIGGEIASLTPTLGDPADPISTPTTVSYPILYRFQDFGSLNKPAHFGYVFPKHMQEMPLTQFSNFTVLNCNANTLNATIHFHLEWSTSDIIPPV